MEFRRQPKGRILLVQEKYAKEKLLRFLVDNCRAVSTPLTPYCKLSEMNWLQTPEERALMVDIPCKSAVGSLMDLAIYTRPDLSALVSSLSRFNGDPGKAHWEGF